MWARATCDSRTVHVPFDSAGALCPMGDLFNYAPPAVPAEIEADSEPLLPPLPREAPERSTGPPSKSQGTPADEPPQPPVDLEAAQLASSRSGESAVHADETAPRPSDDEMVPERICSSGAGGEGSYVESAREYHFRAKTPARKGEQVLMCYGMYSNLELLEHYGFLLPGSGTEALNPHDQVCMPEGLLRRLGLWEEGAGGDATGHYLQASGAPSWDLMCALRLAEEPVHVRSQRRFQARSGDRLSIQGDVGALRRLASICTQLLSGLPTNLLEDGVHLNQLRELRLKEEVLTRAEALEVKAGEAIPSEYCGTTLSTARATREAERLPPTPKHMELAIEWRMSFKRILQRTAHRCLLAATSLETGAVALNDKIA